LKFAVKIVGSLLLAGLIAGSATAQPKARKLTADAYLKTAKIEVSYVDTARYAYATVMLDSLFHYYGPYAEGYYWIAKMRIDVNEKTGDLKKKKQQIAQVVAYTDSLHMVCADPNAKANNKKGCQKFISEIDSIKVFYWRTYYNTGVEQLQQIEEQVGNLAKETDSLAIVELNKVITQNTDSCLDNMELAIMLDPGDPRPYVGLSQAFAHQGKADISTEWLVKGLKVAPDSNKIQFYQHLAINYGSAGKFREAIPYFRGWVEASPKDTTVLPTMSNLAICYNGSQQFDSAAVVYHEMLAIQPTNTKALMGIGAYFGELSSNASDSAKKCDSLGNEKEAKRWRDVVRHAYYDSARIYFKQVFEANPNDTAAAKQYGLMSYLLQDWANTTKAYERVTQLDPSDATGWATLGDCYIYLKRTKDAIAPYEKVIQLEPNNQQVLEQLKLLYTQEGMTAKVAEVEAKLKKP
jgi:tetratricopeptide (TPR) repeat protein